jgi:signal transduction histidine kinase/CheY-like chemotaxis protein
MWPWGGWTMRINSDRVRRYAVAPLAVLAAIGVMAFPVVRDGIGTGIIVTFLAILSAACYGGLGPGLLTTALFALVTAPPSLPAWRAVRLILFLASGVSISALAEILHIARRRAERSEQRYRAAKEAAEAANQAKDHFLAVLSHELRTPLTPVLAAVTGELDRTGECAEIRPVLELIRRSIELEARLIDDLLDVTRITRGKLHLNRETVDAHALLDHTLALCRSDLHDKQMQVRLELAAAHHHVEADPARLQQVLWNLIKNAVKFTPAGGSLKIRTENPGDGSHNGRLLVKVSDTGMGIEHQTLSRIFNAFEQGQEGVTRRFGGLGLGLAISRGVIEAHGGRIWAASPGPGQGATFSIELTTLETPSQTSGEHQPVPGTTPTTRELRILLVEDDHSTLRIMSRLLEQRHYAVTVAETMAAALELGQREVFDLVISDIGLPDGTGWELMRQLRNTGSIKGIALTGLGMDQDVGKTHEAGFAAHLTKPVDFVKLVGMIQQVASEAPPYQNSGDPVALTTS